jgi:hypothetical protein
MIDFTRFSYFVPVLNQVKKNGKKVEKEVFLSIFPGLKSEFLRPKTLFMHLSNLFMQLNSLTGTGTVKT